MSKSVVVYKKNYPDFQTYKKDSKDLMPRFQCLCYAVLIKL